MGAVIAMIATVLPLATPARALPDGFREDIVIDDLNAPTAVDFSPDDRVFVAEKSGIIKVYDSLADQTPHVFADLRTEVHNFWDRGLLGMELHPDFPADPRVYVLYAHDAQPGGTAPRWGTVGGMSDPCPSPPGPTADGCVVTGRLSVLTADGDTAVDEDVLITDWCQQYPSHSTGDLAFGADGALYVSAGDGASFNFADWGQDGAPVNPCDDPPAGVGGAQTPPTAEGGALRSQDLRTTGDPLGLDGTVLRLDPDTGAAMPDNPAADSEDPNERRIVAYGLRNPFRITTRPGTSEVWIGDVGWNRSEEINRIADPTAGVRNFGWPCYEGAQRQGGYDSADLDICEDLYDEGPAAHATPWFAYAHSEQFVAGDGCGTGGSSAAGVAFYDGGDYPDEYDGALFYADYTRRCVWVLFAGADGAPDATTRAPFVAPAAEPVALTAGPGGDLYYVNLGGDIRRISYFSDNQPPVAHLTASPTEGPAPLDVTFDASGSADPDGDDLSFTWDLDGDGDFDDGDAPTANWTYEDPGRVVARVRVTDPDGADDTAQVAIDANNTRPQVSIDAPGADLTWSVGEEIAFAGSATDAQDGTVTDLSWDIVLHHCHDAGDCHAHLLRTIEGADGTLSAPDHEYPSYLELRLTATDSGGLTGTATRRLDPRTTELTVTTDPPGLAVGLGDESGVGPLTREVIAGSTNSVSAPSPQTVDGVTYEFDEWSDDGERSHNVTAPPTPTTLTATFTVAATPFDTRDIGAPALAGSAVQDTDTFTVTGAGNDIWGTSDQFHYASQPLDGDGAITARVVSQTNTNPWAKAGVMIRDGFGADARHAMLALTPGNGVAMQRRTTTGGASQHQAGPAAQAPQWLRLTRVGDLFTGYVSADGASWSIVGSTTVAMGDDVRIGLSVTSHNTFQRSTAVFDGLAIENAAPPPRCATGQWAVDYFDGTALAGAPLAQGCEDAIDHTWGSGGPDGVPTNRFSARWTGTIDVPTGTYVLTARADDGVRVWVDGDLVINAWRDQSATTYTANRQLSGEHAVVVEYYENGGQAVAQFGWEQADP